MSFKRILRQEILSDPLGRNYAGMTDQQVADDLNTPYRTRMRTVVSGAELYELTDIAEFQALGDAQKQFIRDIWGLGEGVRVGPGSKARAVYLNVFGAGSNTVSSIVAALTESISRAEKLGLGRVSAGRVFEARTGG